MQLEIQKQLWFEAVGLSSDLDPVVQGEKCLWPSGTGCVLWHKASFQMPSPWHRWSFLSKP